MDVSEQALVEAAKADPSRFAALYEAHFERIYAFVAHRVRDRGAAEDLTAEVFRRALAGIGSFEWRGAPFAAWLYRIAANEIAENGPRPEGFGTVTTGFRAAGAQQLLEFLQRAFGAVHVSGGMEHAEVRLGETTIELSEAKGEWGPTRGAFHLFVADCDAVYAEAVRAGAKSMWAPEDKPYGERSAGVEDAWGNQWYIATPLATAT